MLAFSTTPTIGSTSCWSEATACFSTIIEADWARDLAGMGLVDEVIPEPPGGAHVNHEAQFKAVDEVLWRQLQELRRVPVERLPEQRYRKFRDMGRLGREFREVTS